MRPRDDAEVTASPSVRHDRARTRAWVRDGTDVLVRALAAVPDADLDAESTLPGWTRRHVLAHLARNADALRRLLGWARTGVVTPMYADAQQRAQEIEASSQASPSHLRRDLALSAAELDADAAALTDEQWLATVRSARGREIPATEVPWMRAREVWLHAIDLRIGVDPAALPAEFCTTLISDVVGFFDAAGTAPAVRIASGDRSWSIGVGGPLVTGDLPEVATWLTGRSTGAGLSADVLPEMPPWL